MRRGILSHKPQTIFRDCRFEGADLLNVDPLSARFERCSFGDLTLWFCFASEFVDCRFSRRIVQCKFSGRPLEDDFDFVKPRRINDFYGNDFRQTELIDTEFIRGIDIDAQFWPEDDIYIRLDHPRQRIAAATREIAAWKDPEAKGQALRMITAYSDEAEEQYKLFVRKDDLSRQQLGDVPPIPRSLPTRCGIYSFRCPCRPVSSRAIPRIRRTFSADSLLHS